MNEKDKINTRSERRDAAENRQRILDAAILLFDLYGVEQVSMNQIATEAQIGPGTLYRRYRNKAELCLDLIKDNIDLLFEDMEAYLQQHRAAPASQRLKAILTFYIRFREQKAQLLTGVEDSASSNRTKSRTKSPIYHELHQIFVSLFDEMTATGEASTNNVFQADLLLAAMSSDFYFFQKEERGYTPEEFVEQVCRSFGL